MRIPFALLPALALALAACGESGSPSPDASTTPPSDAALPAGPDAGLPAGEDAAAPGPDAGPAGLDAAQPGPDAAQPGPDAALPVGPDAGPSEADAGEDTIGGKPKSPHYGAVVFNEVLLDGTTDGDPNGDGDANPVEDQFVELVNVGAAALSLAGFTLVEEDLPDLPRHTFGAGVSLPAGHALVVFGGGDAPDATATCTFFAANAADPGLPFGLHLSTPADALWLLDADRKVVARFCYGGAGDCALAAASDQSLTRSPDRTGAFVPHLSATGATGSFSVGTQVNGSAF